MGKRITILTVVFFAVTVVFSGIIMAQDAETQPQDTSINPVEQSMSMYEYSPEQVQDLASEADTQVDYLNDMYGSTGSYDAQMAGMSSSSDPAPSYNTDSGTDSGPETQYTYYMPPADPYTPPATPTTPPATTTEPTDTTVASTTTSTESAESTEAADTTTESTDTTTESTDTTTESSSDPGPHPITNPPGQVNPPPIAMGIGAMTMDLGGTAYIDVGCLAQLPPTAPPGAVLMYFLTDIDNFQIRLANPSAPHGETAYGTDSVLEIIHNGIGISGGMQTFSFIVATWVPGGPAGINGASYVTIEVDVRFNPGSAPLPPTPEEPPDSPSDEEWDDEWDY